jgi:hypothetical protein
MVVADNEIDETKNAGKLTTISMAMAMQQYDAGRIARWSTSRASLEATGCRHRASACAVSWVGGGGVPLSLGFLEDSGELSTCGGTGLPQKKLKINPLEMDLFLA